MTTTMANDDWGPEANAKMDEVESLLHNIAERGTPPTEEEAAYCQKLLEEAETIKQESDFARRIARANADEADRRQAESQQRAMEKEYAVKCWHEGDPSVWFHLKEHGTLPPEKQTRRMYNQYGAGPS